jgi:hypothetical protein
MKLRQDSDLDKDAPPVDIDRLVLLLNEAYVFLGIRHKALHPWRIALDEWQAKVEQETGWSHFAEVKKFEHNVDVDARRDKTSGQSCDWNRKIPSGVMRNPSVS